MDFKDSEVQAPVAREGLRRNSIYLLPNSFTIAALFSAFFFFF